MDWKRPLRWAEFVWNADNRLFNTCTKWERWAKIAEDVSLVWVGPEPQKFVVRFGRQRDDKVDTGRTNHGLTNLAGWRANSKETYKEIKQALPSLLDRWFIWNCISFACNPHRGKVGNTPILWVCQKYKTPNIKSYEKLLSRWAFSQESDTKLI